MQVGRITAEIRRFGAVATVIWTAPAVLSLTASLYGFVTDNSIDEIDVILAIVGAIALGFAIGSHAMALALEKYRWPSPHKQAIPSSRARTRVIRRNPAPLRHSRRRPPSCALTAAFPYD